MTTTSVTTSTGSAYTVTSGNTLVVANGGVVTGPAVQSSGTLVVNGGTETSATVFAGGTEIVSAGSASGDMIYGVLSTVLSSASQITNEVVESGGKFFEYNSAVVAGTVVSSGGTFILSGNTSGANSNTTLVSGGTVELITAKSTLGGALTFSGGHNTLATSATISSGFGDLAVITGFDTTDVIDIMSMTSATLSVTSSGGNDVATVTSGGVSESFIFAGTTTYTSSTLALAKDAGGHVEIVFTGSLGSTTTVTTSTASGAYTETAGNTLVVATGGSVTAPTISNGGALVVSGGVVSGANVLSGGLETVSAGSASGDQIYGVLSTFSGGTGQLTNEVVQNGGVFYEYNSGTVTGTQVNSGGTFILSGNTSGANSNTTLVSGGKVELITAKATLGGALVFSGGGNTLQVAALSSSGYGDQAVISGFSSTDQIQVTPIAPGATLAFTSNADGLGDELVTISGGGSSESFLFLGSGYNAFTMALQADAVTGVDLVYNPNATTLVISSGTTTGMVVSSGQTVSVLTGATVSSTTVLGGGTLVVSGTDVGTTVSAGGSETAYGSASNDLIAGAATLSGGGAAATGETVLGGGKLSVNGAVNQGATVSAGGSETVLNSGYTSGDQVYGSVVVSGGGAVASGEAVNAGGLLAISGGADTSATISAGGKATVTNAGTATGDQIFGSVTVNGGTVTSETVHSGGLLFVSAGVDSSTTIEAGGNETLLGSAVGDQVYGTQLISAGTAVATGETVFAGGVINLWLKGGVVSSTTVSSGGELTISGNATTKDTVLNGGGVLDLQSPKANVTGSLALNGGGNTLKITGTTSAGFGTTALITGFSDTDAIDLTSAAFNAPDLSLSQGQAGGNTVVEVMSGGIAVETFTFSGLTLSGFFEFAPDGKGGELLETPPVSVTTSVTTSTAPGAFTELATDTLLVLGGGSVTSATIENGGFLTVDGGADSGAVVSSGGLETVLDGSASGDQIYGTATTSGGTVTDETALGGGKIVVNDGASVADVVLGGGGTLDLASPTATVTGTLTFENGANTLLAGAVPDAGAGDQAVITGFSTSDRIDVAGVSSAGSSLGFATDAGGHQVVTVSGNGVSESFIFSDPSAYNAGTMSLFSDGSGGVNLILDTTPTVTITSHGGSTNQATTLVNGTVDTTADPWAVGTTVTVLEGGNQVGTAIVGADGHWSSKVTFADDAGANVLRASDTDTAGNTGATAQSVTYNADTTASAFIPGDLVISIEGNGDGGGQYTLDQASALTLEQITTGGAYVGQIVLPETTTVVGGVTEYGISGEYGSASEGALQLSGDGHSLVIMGYGVDPQSFNAANASAIYGTTALGQTTSVLGGKYTVVPRVIADINANGVIDTSTAVTGVFNTNNPRSVATVDGTSFWIAGQGVKGDKTQGLWYVQDGASTGIAISNATDMRIAEIYNGQLYVSADSTQGSPNISTYGALPTSATSAVVLQNISGSIVVTSANANTVNAADVGQSVNLSPESFFFADANTLYVADSGLPKDGGVGDGGLQKWVYSGGSWNLEYTLSAGLNLVNNSSPSGVAGLFGLTGKVVGDQVQLYATTEGIGELDQSFLYMITDSLSSNTGAGESFTQLMAAGPDQIIRGVAFAPTGYAPTITGAVAGQGTTSETPVSPFSSVTVTDPNSQATETLTITVGGVGGVLSGTGLSGGTGGIYTLSGEAAAVTSELQALSFTPTAGQPNTVSTSTFTLSDQSSAYPTPATDSTTTVLDTVPAVSPSISGTVAGQKTASEAPVTPFSNVTITDANAKATETLTITVGGAGGVLSGTDLSGGTGGIYTLSGSASTVTSDLQALEFAPTAGQPNTVSTSTFSLSDQSSVYATPATDSTTTVLDTDPAVSPTISGAAAGQTTTSEAPVTPFASVTIADTNAKATETLTITVGGAGGVLKGTGLSGGTGGIYVLSGTASAVTSQLEALSFTPAAGAPGSKSTSTFTLSDQSSAYATPATDSTTSVVDTDPPFVLTKKTDVLNGGPAGATIVAASLTLTNGDVIAPSAGANVLVLQGGGTFNLAKPKTLANIATVQASEGAGIDKQTITLRDGLNVTLNVAPSGGAGAGITIKGANDASVINLGTGADAVTLGSSAETVNGGGGVNTISATTATVGALIVDSADKTALIVSGGGTGALNAGDSGIATVTLKSAASAYNFTTNAESGLIVNDQSSGLDTLAAGGGGVTLTGGAPGKVTFVGYSGGGTTFLDKTAKLNGDVIENFNTAGSQIDLTDLVSFKVTGSFTENGAGTAGTLSVTDGKHTASITLFGQYLAAGTSGSLASAGISVASDLRGGTLLTPVLASHG
jgi:autotransporter passenger strand-loop-strand repeat protein